MYKDINDKRLIKFDMFYDRRNIGNMDEYTKGFVYHDVFFTDFAKSGNYNQRNCI